jgi:hypothetical protein
MNSFFIFVLLFMSSSSFAAYSLTCRSVQKETLDWNDYRGELIVYRVNGRPRVDYSELELDKPRLGAYGTMIIDIVPMHGNFSPVATIVKKNRNVSVSFQGVRFYCDK